VQVYGVWYSSTGTFTDTVVSTTGGCDTIVTITITEDPLIFNSVNASHCSGDSVQEYGVWYAGTGSFTDTIASTTSSCDTIVTIVVTEEPLIPKPVSNSYCAGDSVQVYGIWYIAAGSYTDTVLSTTGGCDTLLNITITEDPLLTNSVSDSYCAGDSVQVYGIWYSSTGSFTDTVPSTTGGCDTILTINITEDPLETNSINASYCAGDSVQVGGIWYVTTGVYTDTVPSTTGGCDTILTITITEDPLETKKIHLRQIQ